MQVRLRRWVIDNFRRFSPNCLFQPFVLCRIRRYDTAPHYGKGTAEKRLGKFLATLTDEKLLECEITTKVGRRLVEPKDLAAELRNPEVFGEEPEENFAIFKGLDAKAQVQPASLACR